MNKKIISIICLALIACMICTFVSCNKDKDPADGTNPGTECTTHVDENGDNKCDICNADVESQEPEVPAIDATAMNSLEMLRKKCEKQNIKLILSHVNHQPMEAMKKSGFYNKIGEKYFCAHIDDALNLASQIQQEIKL